MQERNGWPKQGDVFIAYGDGHGEVHRNGKKLIWANKYSQLHRWYNVVLKDEETGFKPVDTAYLVL